MGLLDEKLNNMVLELGKRIDNLRKRIDKLGKSNTIAHKSQLLSKADIATIATKLFIDEHWDFASALNDHANDSFADPIFTYSGWHIVKASELPNAVWLTLEEKPTRLALVDAMYTPDIIEFYVGDCHAVFTKLAKDGGEEFDMLCAFLVGVIFGRDLSEEFTDHFLTFEEQMAIFSAGEEVTTLDLKGERYYAISAL